MLYIIYITGIYSDITSNYYNKHKSYSYGLEEAII